MNQPQSDVRALAGWTPFHLERHAEGPRVHWLQAGPDGFAEPFFERTIRRRLAEPNCRVATTGLDALELLPKGVPWLKPAGFIFHLSRSGSTLLANGLKALDEHLVISEPGPVNQLFSWPEWRAGLEPWQGRLGALIACLGQPFNDRHAKYFIKFSSHNLLEIERILALFPDTPWVVLYRDPIEVLVSALARPPYWMRLYDHPEVAAAELGLAPEQLAGASRETYGARVLARFCEVALAAAEGGGALVNYRQLTAERLGAVCRLLGLAPDDDQLAAMALAFQFDAKSAEPRPYRPDSAAKQATAQDAVRAACAGRLTELFDALERRQVTL